jgi:hypothetical protein
VIQIPGDIAFPDNRERLAPITLPAEQPVAQLEVDRSFAEFFGFEPAGDFLFRVGCRQTGDGNFRSGRIHRSAIVHKPVPIGFRIGRLDDLNNWQIEFGGKLEVACVVRWHGHDGAGTVAGEDVIRDPDGNFFTVDRIDGISAGENAGLFLGQFSTFQVGLLCDFDFVFCDRFTLFRRDDLLNEPVFRRQHHIGRAKKRVGTRGENRDSEF